ncbi:hypothetical protein BDU57DRAFT_272914 [Ampelomyces quisqualis]|uniref:Uncharacterized protein n=1 Tax=Ampelomyces quisqualis TaxID=50730 RepID=A0A6A5QJ76_AMPQU|nr:hypothetical protein BDU57DRAFT_272914 [Ampelomyces quisqualis]
MSTLLPSPKLLLSQLTLSSGQKLEFILQQLQVFLSESPPPSHPPKDSATSHSIKHVHDSLVTFLPLMELLDRSSTSSPASFQFLILFFPCPKNTKRDHITISKQR